MDHGNIDIVRLEAFQALFHPLDERGLLDLLGGIEAVLGGDDDLVPDAFESLADIGLPLHPEIALRRVEIGHAAIKGVAEDVRLEKGDRAAADVGHLQPGLAEDVVFDDLGRSGGLWLLRDRGRIASEPSGDAEAKRT